MKICNGRAMPLQHLYKHAALNYAHQWFTTDKAFMQQMKSGNPSKINQDTVRSIAANYMVARGFKKNNANIWGRVANKLEEFIASNDRDIEKLATDLGGISPTTGRANPSRLISAATKFLWFAGRHEIKIYDKRAVNALHKLNRLPRTPKTYAAYATAWSAEYDIHKAEIRRVIAELPNQLEWSGIAQDSYDDAKAAFTEGWFPDRVFDKCLWLHGN